MVALMFRRNLTNAEPQVVRAQTEHKENGHAET